VFGRHQQRESKVSLEPEASQFLAGVKAVQQMEVKATL
jgi:hypothetical protein